MTETRAQSILRTVYEASLRRSVSFAGGHRSVKRTCQPGYRKVGNVCKRMGTLERFHRRLGHKSAMRKNSARQATIQRKRLHSLSRRRSSGY